MITTEKFRPFHVQHLAEILHLQNGGECTNLKIAAIFDSFIVTFEKNDEKHASIQGVEEAV